MVACGLGELEVTTGAAELAAVACCAKSISSPVVCTSCVVESFGVLVSWMSDFLKFCNTR